MKVKKRNKAALAAAIIMMTLGVLTVQDAETSWYGIVDINGTHAQVCGWVCIAFAILMFVVYLRGSRVN
jgi:cell division protein FtsW (lipid II flippase)